MDDLKGLACPRRAVSVPDPVLPPGGEAPPSPVGGLRGGRPRFADFRASPLCPRTNRSPRQETAAGLRYLDDHQSRLSSPTHGRWTSFAFIASQEPSAYPTSINDMGRESLISTSSDNSLTMSSRKVLIGIPIGGRSEPHRPLRTSTRRKQRHESPSAAARVTSLHSASRAVRNR